MAVLEMAIYDSESASYSQGVSAPYQFRNLL